jgi:hypothetical protein
MSDNTAMIHAAMAKCLGEIGAVGKNLQNKEQGYAYRALADVYRACQPVMAANGVHFAPFAIHDYKCEGFDRGAGKRAYHVTMLVEHRFYAADGSYIPVVTIGEATDFSDKASNKAMSASAKYALVQGFCLPEQDPEADGDHSHPELDEFEKVWAALEARGISDPAAMRAWCETTLARALPNAESLTLADLPKLLEALRPAPAPAAAPPAEDAKTLALRLAATLGQLLKLPLPTGETKKATTDSNKAQMLAWANGFRPREKQVSGFGQCTPSELKELIGKAIAGEMPRDEAEPDWMGAAAGAGAGEGEADR